MHCVLELSVLALYWLTYECMINICLEAVEH